MKLQTKRHNYKQNFTFPEAKEIIFESTPTLIWIPEDGVKLYTVSVWDDSGKEVFCEKCKFNFANITKPLPAGKYTWQVEAEGFEARDVLEFSVSESAVEFLRPTAEEIFAAIPKDRPRHLFTKEDIPALLSQSKDAFEVLRKNVEIALKAGFEAPCAFQYDENALPYREYFGVHRDYVDRDLVALSLYYALTGDESVGEAAKLRLFNICSQNPYGPASPTEYCGDEIGLSNARCLPAVFDLLYPLLSYEDRKFVGRTILTYGKLCKERVDKIDYMKNPSNSHVGRLPAYMGETALCLYGEDYIDQAQLNELLDGAVRIFGGIFPFYGASDGSWAEGTFYATSYTKWYLPFFAAVERYTGHSFLIRPFYQRYVNFLYHFANPDYEIHPFGDGYWCSPTSPEWPGFFAQNPFRVYADKFGTDEQIKLREKLDKCDFYRLHLLDLFIPKLRREEKTLRGERGDFAIFDKGGFAVMHSDISDKNDICVMARASRYGSDSHRHADQGSFALFASGVALISPSGYFGRAYGTKHHFEWTNTTKAHNAILVNGIGQPTFSMDSVGKFTDYDSKRKYIKMDLSDSYRNLKLWQREIFMTPSGIKIIDTVEADEPVEITYPLHALSRPTLLSENRVEIIRSSKKLTVVPRSGLDADVQITDKFDVDLNFGVDEKFHVTAPLQYHIYYTAPSACRHVIEVDYLIENM